MTAHLQGRRIAFLVANEGVEQIELTASWKAGADAGGTPTLVAPEARTVQAFNHLDRADTFAVDMTVADAARRANLVSASLPRYASARHKDPRAPQNLYSIGGLERELRRRLGDRDLAMRALRRARAA